MLLRERESKMTYKAAVFAAAILNGTLATFASSAEAADPVKIRTGWIVMPSNLAPILFAKAGIGRHNDKSYVLEPVYFSSSSVEITALATEEIDIAAMGFSTLPLAIENAGLKDLRLLADEVQDGNGSGFSLQFMVRRDSNINSVADLKGKVLATIGIGTGAHTGMLATLQKFGLQEKRDYTVIETPFPTMKGMLKDRKTDLIAVTTGFATDPELQSIARTLFTQKDGMGPSALSFWAARSGFIAKNRAALVDFLEDAVRATRWYKDPANRKEAVDIVAKAIKQPPERIALWLFSDTEDFYRDPNLAINLSSLQSNINLLQQLGIIKAGVQVDQYSDASLLNEALARLK
jgi:sulfonate transport system substrate-binding protein